MKLLPPSSGIKMEATGCSKNSIPVYKATRGQMPEGSNLEKLTPHRDIIRFVEKRAGLLA
jgi:hypothetical protein